MKTVSDASLQRAIAHFESNPGQLTSVGELCLDGLRELQQLRKDTAATIDALDDAKGQTSIYDMRQGIIDALLTLSDGATSPKPEKAEEPKPDVFESFEAIIAKRRYTEQSFFRTALHMYKVVKQDMLNKRQVTGQSDAEINYEADRLLADHIISTASRVEHLKPLLQFLAAKALKS